MKNRLELTLCQDFAELNKPNNPVDELKQGKA